MESLHESLYNMSGRHFQVIYDETDIDVPELFDMDEIELYDMYECLCEIEDEERESGNTAGNRYRLVYETVRIMAAALSGEQPQKIMEDWGMKIKYPVVTLCGSTRFKDEFMDMQKKLTLQGCIVISVGLFGHSGDLEVWEHMDEGTKTRTKLMLDDMHKEKIDMADEIFVVNPGGYIGDSTWSEICYARMTEKKIESIVPIDNRLIDEQVANHIHKAEKLASMQLDVAQHQGQYFDFGGSSIIRYKGVDVLDPWIKEECQSEPWVWEAHKNPDVGVNPFEYYGKKKTARFVEEILMRREFSYDE
jgi:hypothetical protein